MPDAPLPNYTVLLRIVDSDGNGVPGLAVRALDHDRGREPDELSAGTTAADGRLAISFPGKAAGGREEGNPELFILVHNADGLLVHQSRPLALTTAEHDLGDIVAHRRTIAESAAASSVAGTTGAAGTSIAPQPNDPASVTGTNRFHGSAKRDIVVPHSPFFHGPFGRMFRQQPAWIPPGANDAEKEANVRAIAALMVEPDGPPDAPAGDNDAIPVGYTYFGQFVDHDITFDPASSLSKQNDPDRLINFRTSRYDLDSLYGEGPDDEPFMYDQHPNRRGEFLIGKGRSPQEDDLPRNEQDTALTGDPRNDENIILAQLQLVFLKLHNSLLRRVKAEEGLTNREAFTRAQTLVRWHYQWVVLFDFLPRICGRDVVDELLKPAGEGRPGFRIDLKLYKFRDAPFMPVEFSAAAYRFGHSQIRHRYDLNRVVSGVPIFLPPESRPGELADLRGFRRLPGMWTLDWRRFLEIDGGVPQMTRRIDTRLSRALSSIPAGPDPARGSRLAELNLLRGFRLGLPSGQAVARAMGEKPISNADLKLGNEIAGSEAPLWYYVLKEAELQGDGGRRLGRVGGRIVAETFLGLAKADPSCFLNVDPAWTPARAFANGPPLDTSGNALQFAGLVRAAGAGSDPFRR
ncbi:MAG TPA: heme peroxidase family protein [Allosphingosinicella sp.]|jgi:hypothetical protein